MARSAGGLVTETIASLTGGVSQLADPMRQPDQAEEIINCLLSPTEGLKKRPPSQIIQNLTTAISGNLTAAPYSRTTTDAATSVKQVTVLTFVLEAVGTRYDIGMEFTFPFFRSASYTVITGDTLATVATAIAAAINTVASTFVTAVANVDHTVTLTAVSNNAAFNVLLQRTVPVSAIAPSSCFTHTYQRDLTERYMLIVADGKLTVVDLLNRTFPTVTGGTSSYLATDTPGISIRALTVGDYTFIVNREIQVTQDSTTSSSRDPEALVWVRMGNYGTKYTVTLDGTTYTWYADKSEQRQIDTQVIARALSCKIPSGKDQAKIVLTGTFVIGDTVTVNETVASKTAVYTVKADANDASVVESTHSIAVGIAELWNATAGSTTVAIPVDYDDFFGLADNAILFFSPSAGSCTITTSDTAASGTSTATNIAAQSQTYEVTLNGSSFRVRKYNSYPSTFQDFSIATSDGLGDQAIRAIKGEVQSIEDLPARGVSGFLCKVTGDVNTDKDDYYVAYEDSTTVTNDGVWRESLKGGEHTSLDATTMPHILIRNSDGTFTFEAATWNPRTVGDLTTAPLPSFVTLKINDVMFHKNRLGFVADQNTVWSQTGKYFNFMRVSVQQLLDEDIIDYGVASTEVAPIRHVVAFQNKVSLWSDRVQLIESGEPIFTAKTIVADPVTRFECSQRARPFLMGKDIMFAADRNSATKLMDFFSADSGTQHSAQDLTLPVPSYLQGKPLAICGGINPSMLFVATLTNTNDLYVLNYQWNTDQDSIVTPRALVQSAWSTWRFEDGNILSVEFIENTLYLVIQRGPIVMLEKVDILPADVDNATGDIPSDHLVYLDLRFGTSDFTQFGVTVAYDSMTGYTTWTFASDVDHAVPHHPAYPMKVVKKPTLSSSATTELPGITRPAANKIAALGDWHATDVWIGLEYPQELEFSTFYTREQTEDGRIKSITDGTTTIHKLKLDYKAGYFTVEVLPDGRSTPYTYEFSGSDEVTEGTFEVPIQNKNTQVNIKIKNTSFRPANITGMAWEGLFQRRTGGK